MTSAMGLVALGCQKWGQWEAHRFITSHPAGRKPGWNLALSVNFCSRKEIFCKGGLLKWPGGALSNLKQERTLRLFREACNSGFGISRFNLPSFGFCYTRKVKIRLTQWMMITILSYLTAPSYPLSVMEYCTVLMDVMGDPIASRAS